MKAFETLKYQCPTPKCPAVVTINADDLNDDGTALHNCGWCQTLLKITFIYTSKIELA